jgi:hypothetical protein
MQPKRLVWSCGLRGYLGVLLALPLVARAAPPPGAGEARPLILAHYMSWYEGRPASPRWGWHWTMNAFNPDRRTAGQPEIASHYHPLIGPYDSGDPDVLEYHALSMKLAGIDGVIVDWYGREDYLDYAAIHRNAARLQEVAGRVHLKFAVCYEDQTILKLVEAGRLRAADRVAHAREDIDWLRREWFRSPDYLKRDGKPVLLSFGRSGLDDDEWQSTLNDQAGRLTYLSEHHLRRGAAAGAFDWPVPQVGLKAQDAFYREARAWPTAMAVAFPRFHDIYKEARIHESWGRIADDAGKTFETTLERALRSGLPMVQVSTWNDWGEGTVIEPSAEFGYRDLEVVQRLRKRHLEPDFSATADDLRLPHRLFKLRKAETGRVAAARELDRIAGLLADRSTGPAREALDRLDHRRAGEE